MLDELAPAQWLARMGDVEARAIEKFVQVWPTLVSSGIRYLDENGITLDLYDAVKRSGFSRTVAPIEVLSPVVKRGQDGHVTTDGELDLRIDIGDDPAYYLAIECKRLNGTDDSGKWESLAGKYVNDGLSRFVHDRYAPKVPLAAMLGYVMDGDVPRAVNAVRAKIEQERAVIGAVGTPVFVAVPTIHGHPRFCTRHQRKSGNPMEIRHTFLAC